MTRLLLLLLAAIAAMVERNPLSNQHDPDRPTWVFGPLNSPQAERGGKSNLARWPQRGKILKALALRDGVTFFGMQEVGPRHVQAFATGVLKFIRARPNQIIGHFQVGNGGLLNTLVLELLHRRLLVAWNRVGFRFIPVLLCADRGSDDRIILIPGHADKKRPRPEPGERVLRAIAREGARLYRLTGVPVVALLDSNNSPAADRIFSEYGWTRILGAGDIDKGYGLGVEARNERTLDGYHGTVTDHPNPKVVDVSPTTRNFTLTRLPRLSRRVLALLKKTRRPR